MMKLKRPFRAIWVLVLTQSVPIAACSSDDAEDEDVRDENRCQSAVTCGAARFNFSDALPHASYTLKIGLPDDEIDCTFRVGSDGSIGNDCDIDLTNEYLQVDVQGQPVTLELTDEKGCSTETRITAADYSTEGSGCDFECQRAEKTVDLSECAAGWYCEIGKNWSETCDSTYINSRLQVAEGCGYTWVKMNGPDTARNTIVDANGIVVFQEVWDPLSPGSWCLASGTIPDCADFPDNTTGWWQDVPHEDPGYECDVVRDVDEIPACEIGYDWADECGKSFAGLGTQVLEGCGYTWIRGLYADSQRDTIVDEDGIVVFQEWYDPLSTVNPAGCRGGTIPVCDNFPTDTNTQLDVPAPFRGDECWEEGMGGAGGAAN